MLTSLPVSQHLWDGWPGPHAPVGHHWRRRQPRACFWSLQPFHHTCCSHPAAFHQPFPAQWLGHRARLWDERCWARLPPDSATHWGFRQPLPSTALPLTDLDDSAAEWIFLRRLGIHQAGTEATESASRHLHQPLHDWILIKPICRQTSDHQPILVALCPRGVCSLGPLYSLEL